MAVVGVRGVGGWVGAVAGFVFVPTHQAPVGVGHGGLEHFDAVDGRAGWLVVEGDLSEAPAHEVCDQQEIGIEGGMEGRMGYANEIGACDSL